MNIQELKEMYRADFLDSLATLQHSWIKQKNITIPSPENKALDELEPWEALTARFARCTDIFLSKFVRVLILELDPGFRGEMRDYLDKAEKAGIISNATEWMKVRELRNKISHEYTRADLIKTLKEVLNFTPFVLNELEKFKS